MARTIRSVIDEYLGDIVITRAEAKADFVGLAIIMCRALRAAWGQGVDCDKEGCALVALTNDLTERMRAVPEDKNPLGPLLTDCGALMACFQQCAEAKRTLCPARHNVAKIVSGAAAWERMTRRMLARRDRSPQMAAAKCRLRRVYRR